jgi:hypothetical protein
MTIPECPVCGTWVCAQCGWKRHGASLTWKHTCHRCGGTRGLLIPSRHRDETIRADHAAAAAEPAPKEPPQ